MKTVIAVMSLSIVSATVGVFAAKELHAMTLAAGGSNAVIRASTAGATSEQQSQQIKQQVNPDPDDK